MIDTDSCLEPYMEEEDALHISLLSRSILCPHFDSNFTTYPSSLPKDWRDLMDEFEAYFHQTYVSVREKLNDTFINRSGAYELSICIGPSSVLVIPPDDAQVSENPHFEALQDIFLQIAGELGAKDAIAHNYANSLTQMKSDDAPVFHMELNQHFEPEEDDIDVIFDIKTHTLESALEALKNKFFGA